MVPARPRPTASCSAPALSGEPRAGLGSAGPGCRQATLLPVLLTGCERAPSPTSLYLQTDEHVVGMNPILQPRGVAGPYFKTIQHLSVANIGLLPNSVFFPLPQTVSEVFVREEEGTQATYSSSEPSLSL